MNKHQTDKFGMIREVNDFMEKNAASFVTAPMVATKSAELKTAMDDILKNDGEAETPGTGIAIDKKNLRLVLEVIALKVRNAMVLLYESTATAPPIDLGLLKKRGLARMSDGNLYKGCKELYEAALPVQASLTPFNSGPADVTALNTAKENFFAVISAPAKKRRERKEEVKQIKLLFKQIDGVLKSLDLLISGFGSMHPELVSQYRRKRNIWDSRGYKKKEEEE